MLAFVAAVFAAANVVGGYVVTGRMLKMFQQGGPRRRPLPRQRAARSGAGAAAPRRRARPGVMSGFTFGTQLVYVLAASCFVLGLHLMNTPATARRGNQVSTAGMAIAVIATLVLLIAHDGADHRHRLDGDDRRRADRLGGVGLYAARTVQMTAMPQLVSHVQRGRRRRGGAGRDLRLHSRRVGAGRRARHHVGRSPCST